VDFPAGARGALTSAALGGWLTVARRAERRGAGAAGFWVSGEAVG